MNYSTALAGVNTGTKKGYRGTWSSRAAIIYRNNEVEYWDVTNHGAYNPSAADQAAEDWVLEAYNGDLPPR